MKKLAFLVSLMCASITMMAAPTISGTSQIDLSSAGQTDKYVRFVISTSFSDGFDNTWDTPAANESGIYVVYNSARYTGWASNQYSENLPLGFYTCENTAYTLKFSSFTGASYEIYDRVADQTITVNGSTPNYEFTIAASEKNSQINDRFVINYNPAASVTTNDDGWASFAYTADVAPAYPAGLTAYKGALNTSDPANMVVDLTEVTAIPAGAGVFVHGAANTTYYFSAAASAPALTGNQIVGCTTATDPAGITDAIYTLRNVGGTTALYQYVGTEAIPAGKAYLPIAISAGAPARIAIRVAQPTDVREVEANVKAEKFMEDGKIYIRRGDNIYNLQGQKVN